MVVRCSDEDEWVELSERNVLDDEIRKDSIIQFRVRPRDPSEPMGLPKALIEM